MPQQELPPASVSDNYAFLLSFAVLVPQQQEVLLQKTRRHEVHNGKYYSENVRLKTCRQKWRILAQWHIAGTLEIPMTGAHHFFDKNTPVHDFIPVSCYEVFPVE